MKEVTYEVDGQGTLKQDVYAGPNCDEKEPYWFYSGEMHGAENLGKRENLDFAPDAYPPGTKITVEVPYCPECSMPRITGEDKCECEEWDWNAWDLQEFS